MNMIALDSNKKAQVQADTSLRCSACGECYNFVFLPSITLAFCSNSNLDFLDETVLRIQREHYQGRVNVTCKDH